MKRSGSVVVVVAAAWCACALGWPRGATEEMHKKSQEHREMHRKSKGLLGEISTMSIMKVYPKPILREMHDFWCQEREEARVDRVESAVCDHWEDVRGGGFYSGANKSPPVDEVEEMHARGPRPSAARFFSRAARHSARSQTRWCDEADLSKKAEKVCAHYRARREREAREEL